MHPQFAKSSRFRGIIPHWSEARTCTACSLKGEEEKAIGNRASRGWLESWRYGAISLASAVTCIRRPRGGRYQAEGPRGFRGSPGNARCHEAKGVLTHKKYWDMEAFGKHDTPQEPRRPPIAIDIPRGTEDDEILQKLPIRTRPRKDSEDDEDIPAPKRQATFRRLRPRGNKGPHKEEMVAVPVGKVVASGKGWITIDVDDSDN
ncbi:hypothetical protein C8J57DRAFT_1235093 [Mycena rebaudengoi]|nr:hypothetical protein C8J57DRAFT_1235093 [Mycena rebaudengoi]